MTAQICFRISDFRRSELIESSTCPAAPVRVTQGMLLIFQFLVFLSYYSERPQPQRDFGGLGLQEPRSHRTCPELLTTRHVQRHRTSKAMTVARELLERWACKKLVSNLSPFRKRNPLRHGGGPTDVTLAVLLAVMLARIFSKLRPIPHPEEHADKLWLTNLGSTFQKEEEAAATRSGLRPRSKQDFFGAILWKDESLHHLRNPGSMIPL